MCRFFTGAGACTHQLCCLSPAGPSVLTMVTERSSLLACTALHSLLSLTQTKCFAHTYTPDLGKKQTWLLINQHRAARKERCILTHKHTYPLSVIQTEASRVQIKLLLLPFWVNLKIKLLANSDVFCFSKGPLNLLPLLSLSVLWELSLDILYVITENRLCLRKLLKFSYWMGHSHIGFRGAELMLRIPRTT